MVRPVRIVLGLMILAAIAVIVLVAAGFRATQEVPEFYERALARPPVEQEAAADELEREVLELHNEARKPGRWEARFTEEHINGWLASDLPEKFPGALPDGVSDPRVAIEPGRMQLAVRYEQGDISTVVSLAGDAFLTDHPNEVAIHVQQVRAGAVPVPLARFLDDISERATDAGLALRWSEQEGDPVALVTLPLDRDEFKGKQLHVERLEIGQGEIVISGRTEVPGADSAEAGSAGEGDGKIDLVGVWKCVSAVNNGKALSDETVKVLRLTVTKEGGYKTERGEEVLFDSTHKIDATKTPHEIDLIGTEGANKGKAAQGIFTLEGDTLTICYTMPGKERPKELASPPGSEATLVVWKRTEP